MNLICRFTPFLYMEKTCSAINSQSLGDLMFSLVNALAMASNVISKSSRIRWTLSKSFSWYSE